MWPGMDVIVRGCFPFCYLFSIENWDQAKRIWRLGYTGSGPKYRGSKNLCWRSF